MKTAFRILLAVPPPGCLASGSTTEERRGAQGYEIVSDEDVANSDFAKKGKQRKKRVVLVYR